MRAAGLLSLCRLVERDFDRSVLPAAARKTRFCYDTALLSALVDRWRPETHSFHLTVGEMSVTLQDVAYQFGLPIAGAPVVTTDPGLDWREAMTARFAAAAAAARKADAPTFTEIPHDADGVPLRWLKLFSVSQCPHRPVFSSNNLRASA